MTPAGAAEIAHLSGYSAQDAPRSIAVFSSVQPEPLSKPIRVVGEASLGREVECCEELCRAALALDFLGAIGQLPLAPRSPQACFDLVLGIPYDAGRMELARRLKRAAAHGGWDPFRG